MHPLPPSKTNTLPAKSKNVYIFPAFYIVSYVMQTLLCCEAGQFQSVQQSAISPASCSFASSL